MARGVRKITATEMKYMRRTAGYTWADYKTNTQIAKELKITQIWDKLLEYKPCSGSLSPRHGASSGCG